MFTISSQVPLPIPCGDPCRGMAFDGCRYYLTGRCTAAVTVLDRDLRPVETVETARIYTALCYDPDRACFWAVSCRCPAVLFRLDRDLREVLRFALRPEHCRAEALTGVSFCCGSGSLLVSTPSQVLEVDPDARRIRPLWADRDCSLVLSLLCIPPYLLLCVLQDCRAELILLSREGRVLAREPAEDAATALVLDPCTLDVLALTAREGCRLLRLEPDRELQDALCPCNRALCRRCVEEPPCEKNTACGSVLESVALVEAALAHILNAEGEKLQAAIAADATPRDLLAVNASVQRTIVHVTALEQALAAKLAAVERLCCGASPCGPK